MQYNQTNVGNGCQVYINLYTLQIEHFVTHGNSSWQIATNIMSTHDDNQDLQGQAYWIGDTFIFLT